MQVRRFGAVAPLTCDVDFESDLRVHLVEALNCVEQVVLPDVPAAAVRVKRQESNCWAGQWFHAAAVTVVIEST